MGIHFRIAVFIGLSLGLFSAGCSGKEEATKETSVGQSAYQQNRSNAFPDSLKWNVSMTARTVPENRIKNARRREDVPPLKLKELFTKAAEFLPLVKPISPSDSVVKFLGFDFHYFVPSMELFDKPQRYALYRRGNDDQPAAVAIYDSIGLNNAEVFPFFYNNMVIYFFHYFGNDVTHSKRKVIPGFFTNDFDGEGAVYFQPHPQQDQMKTLEDCGAIMLLTKELHPDHKITLDHLQVLTRSKIKYSDTIQFEELYDFRYGRRCGLEYLDENMVYQEMIDYINDNRCGGGKVKILPVLTNKAYPLWVDGPEYAHTILEGKREVRVNKRDSATTWLVGGSGKNWRKVSREVPEVKLSALLKEVAVNEPRAVRPKAGSRLFLGSGWDLRNMCVDTDKPGDNSRYAFYHEREDGSPDFISLVDSSGHGITNLEVYPFYTGGVVIYFLDYFAKDHLHQDPKRIPGFFTYWDQDKRHYYFMPVDSGKKISSVTDIGAVMELQNELHPRKSVLFEQGKPVKQLDYKFEKGDGKDRQAKTLRVRNLAVGDQECAVKSLDPGMTLTELFGFVRSARCGKPEGEVEAQNPGGAAPVWMIGTGYLKGKPKP